MEYDMSLAHQSNALAERWDQARQETDLPELFDPSDLQNLDSNQIGECPPLLPLEFLHLKPYISRLLGASSILPCTSQGAHRFHRKGIRIIQYCQRRNPSSILRSRPSGPSLTCCVCVRQTRSSMGGWKRCRARGYQGQNEVLQACIPCGTCGRSGVGN